MKISFKLVLFAAIFTALSSLSLHAQSGTTYRDGPRITCASDDGYRHYCAADTRYGVRMVNQRSNAACIQGSTWGFDRRGIWVDRGCRADFIVRALVGPGPGPGFIPGPPGPPPGPPGPVIINCSSNDGGRVRCPADTRFGVRLVQQRSDAPCIQGRTWGYTPRHIWVDRGCRADFALRR